MPDPNDVSAGRIIGRLVPCADGKHRMAFQRTGISFPTYLDPVEPGDVEGFARNLLEWVGMQHEAEILKDAAK